MHLKVQRTPSLVGLAIGVWRSTAFWRSGPHVGLVWRASHSATASSITPSKSVPLAAAAFLKRAAISRGIEKVIFVDVFSSLPWGFVRKCLKFHFLISSSSLYCYSCQPRLYVAPRQRCSSGPAKTAVPRRKWRLLQNSIRSTQGLHRLVGGLKRPASRGRPDRSSPRLAVYRPRSPACTAGRYAATSYCRVARTASCCGDRLLELRLQYAHRRLLRPRS